MGSESRASEIVDLAGLARTLELGGIYNGAKLVRAILERELLTLADASRPSAGAEAAGRLDELADRADAEGDGRLGAALRAAGQAAREDAPLSLADAPAVFTCRTCGALAMGEPPGRCPHCEAPTLVFREHLPVWYLESMPTSDALAALAAGPDEVEAIVGDHDDETLARRPRPGEWSARDTLEHLTTAEDLLAVRVPRLLFEADPELVASAAWAETGGDDATAATASPASVLAARFRRQRETTVRILRDIPIEAWERPGRHPEWGAVTVRSQVVYFVRHQAAHMAQLAAAVEGRVPGERR